jgi:hypothetical protein
MPCRPRRPRLQRNPNCFPGDEQACKETACGLAVLLRSRRPKESKPCPRANPRNPPQDLTPPINAGDGQGGSAGGGGLYGGGGAFHLWLTTIQANQANGGLFGPGFFSRNTNAKGGGTYLAAGILTLDAFPRMHRINNTDSNNELWLWRQVCILPGSVGKLQTCLHNPTPPEARG